ncbi:hypothetical protein DFJ74DRAFT_640793 [Hyaloraphidium curvatum]|nr:hypothetical protein DFJ74DRAFT_640793 [Hyaloraphidium curvatum]
MGRRKPAKKAGDAADGADAAASAAPSPPEPAGAPAAEVAPPALDGAAKAARKKEMLETLEREAAARSRKMEDMVDMLCRALVIRCEAILDRVPAEARAMRMRDVAQGKGPDLASVLRGKDGVRLSFMPPRHGVAGAAAGEAGFESPSRKRKRDQTAPDEVSPAKRPRTVDENEEDDNGGRATRASSRFSVSQQDPIVFNQMLPQTPSVANRPIRKPRKNERLFSINGSPLRANSGGRGGAGPTPTDGEEDAVDPLVGGKSADAAPASSKQPAYLPAAEFAFNPDQILSAALHNFVPKDGVQKREVGTDAVTPRWVPHRPHSQVDLHIKKMKEEFMKLQKMVATGAGQAKGATKKAPVAATKAGKAKVDTGRR